jgi:hypothetical protein
MRLQPLIALSLAVVLGGCDNSVKLSAQADDGEEFNGVAIGTGFWDMSGTLQLVSNRGMNCVGTYVFEGVSGPKGKATFNCSNGAAGEAALDNITKTGAGTLGPRSISFRWR